LDWDWELGVRRWAEAGSVGALRLAQVEVEVQRMRWWNTRHVIWISPHSEEVETVASSPLPFVQPWARERGEECGEFQDELQRELDRSRIKIGNDHDHDYHDGCRNDLEIGGIVLALVAMVHFEVHLGSSSSSAPSAAASTSSTPCQCTTHRLRRAYKDRHPRH
jgi:hypothetical protein